MWDQLLKSGTRVEWLSIGASVLALLLSAICCLVTVVALRRAARAEAIARQVVAAVNERSSDLDDAVNSAERASFAAIQSAAASKESATAAGKAIAVAMESAAASSRAAESAQTSATASSRVAELAADWVPPPTRALEPVTDDPARLGPQV